MLQVHQQGGALLIIL